MTDQKMELPKNVVLEAKLINGRFGAVILIFCPSLLLQWIQIYASNSKCIQSPRTWKIMLNLFESGRSQLKNASGTRRKNQKVLLEECRYIKLTSCVGLLWAELFALKEETVKSLVPLNVT